METAVKKIDTINYKEIKFFLALEKTENKKNLVKKNRNDFVFISISPLPVFRTNETNKSILRKEIERGVTRSIRKVSKFKEF